MSLCFGYLKIDQGFLLGHLSDILWLADDGCSQDRFKSETKWKFNKVSLFRLKVPTPFSSSRIILGWAEFPQTRWAGSLEAVLVSKACRSLDLCYFSLSKDWKCEFVYPLGQVGLPWEMFTLGCFWAEDEGCGLFFFHFPVSLFRGRTVCCSLLPPVAFEWEQLVSIQGVS